MEITKVKNWLINDKEELKKYSKEELIEIIYEMKDTLEKIHTNNIEMLEILKKVEK